MVEAFGLIALAHHRRQFSVVLPKGARFWRENCYLTKHLHIASLILTAQDKFCFGILARGAHRRLISANVSTLISRDAGVRQRFYRVVLAE